MASNLTGLPPSALGRVAAQTVALEIAVRVVSLPGDLRQNAGPLKLEGVVTGQNPDGSVAVQTERGTIAVMLRDRQSLPPGQRLEIDLPAGRNPQLATLRPAAQTTAPLPTAPEAAPPVTMAGQLAAALRLERGQPVRPTEIEDALRLAAQKLAEIVSVKLPAAPLQPGQSLRLTPVPPGQAQALPVQPGQVTPLPPGDLIEVLTRMVADLPESAMAQKAELSSLILRVSKLSVPVSSPLNPPPQIAAQPSDPEGQLNIIRNAPTQTISPLRPLDIQVLATASQPVRPGTPAPAMQVAMPGQTPAAGVTLPPGSPILPAQVIGFTTNNLPILSLSLPDGTAMTYVAQFRASNLSPGSPVLVGALPQSAPLTPVSLPMSSWAQPGVWDSLSELFHGIGQVNPGMAQALAQIIPSPTAQPQQLGAMAMLVLSVIRSGDLESLIQPQTAALLRQAGKSEALRAASSDLALAGRTENSALPQDWRVAVLPFAMGQQIHKLPLYYKHMPDEDGSRDKDRRARLLRFLFDLKLSRMGNVQIDGFMQPERLDMIMRTKSPLSVPMQRTMQGLYVGAMEKSNLHGELTFQFKPEHWVGVEMPSDMVESFAVS